MNNVVDINIKKENVAMNNIKHEVDKHTKMLYQKYREATQVRFKVSKDISTMALDIKSFIDILKMRAEENGSIDKYEDQIKKVEGSFNELMKAGIQMQLELFELDRNISDDEFDEEK